MAAFLALRSARHLPGGMPTTDRKVRLKAAWSQKPTFTPTRAQIARPGRAEASTRGGLAPRQIREVTTHMKANLEATITVKHLAALVRLSSYHFCRAFRISFGDSPHGYLMRRRVERAQGLMLTSNVPLGQIAAACGLADQAHFN
jgi:AraC family transcriptional regulator